MGTAQGTALACFGIVAGCWLNWIGRVWWGSWELGKASDWVGLDLKP